MDRRTVSAASFLVVFASGGLNGLASVLAGDASAGPLLLLAVGAICVPIACYQLVGDPSEPEPGRLATAGAVLGAALLTTLFLADVFVGVS